MSHESILQKISSFVIDHTSHNTQHHIMTKYYPSVWRCMLLTSLAVIALPLVEAFSSCAKLSRAVRMSSMFRQQRQQYPIGRLMMVHGTTCHHHHEQNPEERQPPPPPTDSMRRKAFASLLFGASAIMSATLPAEAVITDETDAFANTAKDSSYRGLTTTPSTIGQQPKSNVTPQSKVPTSDEISISVPKKEISGKGLGIELGEVQFQTAIRVFVKSVAPDSVAQRLGIQQDWVVVSVNGQSVERTNREGVAISVYRATQATPDTGSIQLVFRDPAVFQQRLRAMATAADEQIVTTQVAPEGDTMIFQRNWDGSLQTDGPVEMTRQSDQRLSVTQLVPPKLCTRGATTGDLLEISYLGSVVDTGATFDGSAVRINGEGIPGRGNDVSIFFVLRKQTMGQFPPGWDVGLEGMCVGERRRLIIPPALAYGAVGVPRRGIPPNATLQYDITLVSINGLATPQ